MSIQIRHTAPTLRAVLLGLLAASALLSQASAATAQSSEATPPRGTYVRVRTTVGETIEGQLWRSDELGVVLVDDRDREHTVEWADVDGFWRRRSRAAPVAASVAPVGALGFGSFVGLLAAGLCDQAVCEGEFTAGFVRAAPFGAAAGAVLGALAGSAFHRWVLIEDPETVPGSPLTWRVHVGESHGTEAGPHPTTMTRAAMDWNVRRSLAISAEVVRLGYKTTQRVFDPFSPISPYANEDATTTSFLVGVVRPLDEGNHLRVTASAGYAWSRLVSDVREPTGFGFSGTLVRNTTGVHVGAGVSAGWAFSRRTRARFGFEGRADWIPSAPLSDLPILTFSVGVWG